MKTDVETDRSAATGVQRATFYQLREFKHKVNLNLIYSKRVYLLEKFNVLSYLILKALIAQLDRALV